MKPIDRIARIEALMPEKNEKTHGVRIELEGSDTDLLQLTSDIIRLLVRDLGLPKRVILWVCVISVWKGLKTHEADS